MNVLIGYLIDGKSSGIDKYIIRMLGTLKEKDIKFSCLTNEKTTDLQKVFSNYPGIQIIEIPSLKHPLKQFQFLCELMKKNAYDEVYLNISESFNCITAVAASYCHINRIIVHSHSTQPGGRKFVKRMSRKFLHEIIRPFWQYIATDYRACSEEAGKWMFTKKIRNSGRYEVIPNVIDSSRFIYNEDTRKRMRVDLGIDDRFVVGHVGSFSYAKNNFFLLEIIRELRKRIPEAVLLSAGAGEDFDAVCEKAEADGLMDNIIFLGIRSDVPDLMQAMDCFVMPSRFEGQPIVAIESQSSGMPVFISNTIPNNAILSEHCFKIPIDNGAGIWADEIVRHKEEKHVDIRKYPLNDKLCDAEKQAKQIQSLFI